MLVFFALGNAKVLSFALGDAKVPNGFCVAVEYRLQRNSLVCHNPMHVPSGFWLKRNKNYYNTKYPLSYMNIF